MTVRAGVFVNCEGTLLPTTAWSRSTFMIIGVNLDDIMTAWMRCHIPVNILSYHSGGLLYSLKGTYYRLFIVDLLDKSHE